MEEGLCSPHAWGWGPCPLMGLGPTVLPEFLGEESWRMQPCLLRSPGRGGLGEEAWELWKAARSTFVHVPDVVLHFRRRP